MAASNTPKKSTTKGRTSGKKKTSGRTSTKKNTTGKQSISSGFQTEIILLVLMAASIILMVSCIGLGGSVGGTISKVLMGGMGLMAYVFPIVLFIMAAFLISNKGNVLAYKKTAAAAVLFLVFCGLTQLFTEGYAESTTLAEYYRISAEYRTGGGAIGGAICISTISAFGTIGAYVIIVLVILVCLILITQHSFLGFLYMLYDRILEAVKGRQALYQEGAPERELKKQLKAQQRQMAAQERREKRMQELEAALAEEGLDTEEESSSLLGKKSATKAGTKSRNASGSRSGKRTQEEAESRRRRQRGNENQSSSGFLNGTDLFGNKKAEGDPEPAEQEFPLNPENAVNPEGENPENGMEFTYAKENSGSGFPANNLEADGRGAHEDAQMKFAIHRSEPEWEEIPETDAEASAVKEQDESYMDSPVLPEAARGLKEPASGENGTCNAGTVRASSQENGNAQERAALEDTPAHQPARNPKSSKQEIANGIVNIQHEINTQEAAVKKEYQYPPVSLLKRGNGKAQGDSDAHLRKTAQKLQEILYNFGVNAKVTNVSCGPTVTRYELQPEMGVKVSKIVGLSDDIKLNLAAPDIRIEAPIPGKAAVGIEVPNKEHSAVMLRDLIQSPEFMNAKSKLAFAAGKDIEGKTVVADIARMPHLLIAGSTGSGKSVCINTLIISILYKAKPDEVKLIMIDPKVVELSVYNGIPHLFIPVVTDPKKAAGALNWAVSEMSNRYNTFAEYGVRNLEEFNRKIEKMKFPEGEQRPEKMCQIVIIVDELADLMMVAPGEVEDAICRLAQLARAAGIHLVIATQRPSVNVITGLIKANMPSRIAFAVTSGFLDRYPEIKINAGIWKIVIPYQIKRTT